MNCIEDIGYLRTRALLQLSNRLHGMIDPASRTRMFIQGLCELVEGVAGMCIMLRRDPITGRVKLVSKTDYRATTAISTFPTNHDIATEATDSGCSCAGQSSQVNEGLVLRSLLTFSGSQLSIKLSLFRPAISGEPFSQLHQELVDVIHSEMSWIYQPDVYAIPPTGKPLTPRARQTLESLLAGLSEKQTAMKLQLSLHTVHHYVKLIHKHFEVSSRSELLARWVKK